MTNTDTNRARPPSVDALARDLASSSSLPHAVLVECARRAVRDAPHDAPRVAAEHARDIRAALFTDVINGTGVLLHTNMGRAPLRVATTGRPLNLELDLATGERGSRQASISRLISLVTGAEDAVVVNNNAAAVLLVLAALAQGRDVAVSRGESVEIGGGFRIPEVMEQSGARLVDVGTTNKTRLRDYARAVESRRTDVALIMKVHPSNFSVRGFTESTTVAELSSLDPPVVADIGSGLLDNGCPWLTGRSTGLPSWLADEPAAKQILGDGASLVTFSGDKMMGGPQCGIIAGRRELVRACAEHPLMRALRPGAHVMMLLQQVLLAYLDRSACETIPFWSMVATTVADLEQRARDIAGKASTDGIDVSVRRTDAVVGAGSVPDASLVSVGLAVTGDHRARLRSHVVPVVARASDGATIIDLRTVRPEDDPIVLEALRTLRT